jgi:hypothetical protein
MANYSVSAVAQEIYRSLLLLAADHKLLNCVES